MIWVGLSLLAAFGQAFGWALKKRALVTQGINNILGATSFLVAGGTLFIFWLFLGRQWPNIASEYFLVPLAVMVSGNIIAVWAAYRALEKGSFARLMPLMSFTALLVVPVEYYLRGLVPTKMQLLGAALIVAGALLFSSTKSFLKEKGGWGVYGYFGLTLIIYSFMPVFQALMVETTKDGLFSAAIIHLSIGIGFIPLVIFSQEIKSLRGLIELGQYRKLLWFIVGSGLVIGFLENGPATIALE